MKRLLVVIELTADAIFPESVATAGVPSVLPFIPGRTLLGWTASALYRDLDDKAWETFHSGRVRFGHGWPLTHSHQMAFPGPQCWFEKKREKGGVTKEEEGLTINPQDVRNLQHCEGFETEEKKPVQAEALKNIQLAADGSIAQLKRGYRMMTAVKEGTRQKENSALFGHEFLRSSQHFAVIIEADDGFDTDIWEKIRARFHSGAPMKLGQSRKSEYGGGCRYKVVAEGSGVAVPWDHNGTPHNTNELTLWCLSDLALTDPQTGAPVLTPGPRHLGLPDGELVVEKSFVSTRRYSLFNGFARCHESELNVIAAGSILHFKLDAPLSDDDLSHLSFGIGMGREMGLGRVWPNPPCLMGKKPIFDKGVHSLAIQPEPAATAMSQPDDWPLKNKAAALKVWAEAKRQEIEQGEARESIAKKWREKLDSILQLFGRLGLEPPSLSQWAVVRQACERHKASHANLNEALLGRGAGICRTHDQNDSERHTVWTEKVPHDPPSITDWLQKKIEAKREDTGAILLLVINDVMREQKQQESYT